MSRLISPAFPPTLLISSVLLAQQQADTSEPEPTSEILSGRTYVLVALGGLVSA